MSVRACDHRSLAALRRDARADLARAARETEGQTGPPSRLRRLGVLLLPHVQCVLWHRVAHLLHARGWRRLAGAIAWCNRLVHKATIEPASCVGGGWFLPHPAGVAFHARAGEELTMYSFALCAPLRARDEGPNLGDRVTIGVHAAVLGSVTVGSDSAVRYRTDLLRDVSKRCVAASRQARCVVSTDQST